jgi:hypothetical protein
MERAGGHNMVHGGRARGNFRVADPIKYRACFRGVETGCRAVETTCLNSS